MKEMHDRPNPYVHLHASMSVISVTLRTSLYPSGFPPWVNSSRRPMNQNDDSTNNQGQPSQKQQQQQKQEPTQIPENRVRGTNIGTEFTAGITTTTHSSFSRTFRRKERRPPHTAASPCWCCCFETHRRRITPRERSCRDRNEGRRKRRWDTAAEAFPGYEA